MSLEQGQTKPIEHEVKKDAATHDISILGQIDLHVPSADTLTTTYICITITTNSAVKLIFVFPNILKDKTKRNS